MGDFVKKSVKLDDWNLDFIYTEDKQLVQTESYLYNISEKSLSLLYCTILL